MKFTQNITLAAVALLGLCGCALAGGYGPNPAVYAAPAVYAKPVVVATPAYTPEAADAAAAAITDIAAAKASAAKINGLNFNALNNYGHQIGVPLLVRPYGPLTGLYSALAPKRSFVGTIDAGWSLVLSDPLTGLFTNTHVCFLFYYFHRFLQGQLWQDQVQR